MRKKLEELLWNIIRTNTKIKKNNKKKSISTKIFRIKSHKPYGEITLDIANKKTSRKLVFHPLYEDDGVPAGLSFYIICILIKLPNQSWKHPTIKKKTNIKLPTCPQSKVEDLLIPRAIKWKF
jgi:hypothetical protein